MAGYKANMTLARNGSDMLKTLVEGASENRALKQNTISIKMKHT